MWAGQGRLHDTGGSIQFAVEGGDFFPALVARVPGIGVRNARRIVSLRRQRRLRFEERAEAAREPRDLAVEEVVPDRPGIAEPAGDQGPTPGRADG